jgi:hypothetical protein
MLLVVASMTACGPSLTKRQTINAQYDVKVTNPTIRFITDATAKIDLVASGSFTPGTYSFNKKLVTFSPDTTFSLRLTLPINDAGTIHTRDATGSIWTSQPFQVNGVPAPNMLEFGKGQVSGQVDLVRSLGAFLLTFLQAADDDDPDDMHRLIQSLQVKQARLELRPDSYLDFGEKKFHIGPGSTIDLKNAFVDQHFNYTGKLQVHLNLLDRCQWGSSKTLAKFNGGTADIELDTGKVKNRIGLKLTTDKADAHLLKLNDLTFLFGKDLRSHSVAETCLMKLKELDWEYVDGAKRPTFYILASLDLKNSKLDLKTDVQETIATFPETLPAQLEMDSDDTGSWTQFGTTDAATAKTVDIAIAKRTTKVNIRLANVVAGPAMLDKTGAMHFALKEGVAELKQLDWHGNRNQFTLIPEGEAHLAIPQGMLLEKVDPTRSTHLNMPISLDMGAAKVDVPWGRATLNNLHGNMIIDIDREIHLSGDIGFNLPRSLLLFGYPVDLDARGFNLSVVEGKTALSFRNCSLVVPQAALDHAINQKVPRSWTLELDKTISKEKEWRYRNAVAKSLEVKNFELDKMRPAPPDAMAFTARGDVNVTGTVEKQTLPTDPLVAPQWSVHPWSLAARLEGDGKIKYKFIANEWPKDNELEYALSMDFPMPADIKLDWSKVAGGFVGTIERKALLAQLKKMTLPLRYAGKVPVVAKGSGALARHFRVKKLIASPLPDGNTKIDFVADAHF